MTPLIGTAVGGKSCEIAATALETAVSGQIGKGGCIMATPQQSLGAYGEELAASHLAESGYEIAARNWHCRAGELDIVARDGDEWVFVEVRTRRAPNTDSAVESVTSAKEARVLAACQAYLDAHNLEDVFWRVDLVVIALNRHGPQIEVIRDATGW